MRGVSLDVEPGEFLAVTGPSGSGKSTFMHILGCLDRPTSGQYFLDGQDVSRLSKDELAPVRNHQIGFVFQGFNLLSRTTRARERRAAAALQQRRHRRRPSGSGARWSRSKLVGLEQRSHHHPNQLSGGQQQRVAIARALINNPSILLADEPTGNLDTKTRIEVMDVFQTLNEERGITVLLITHERDIAEYGTRIVAFRDGVIEDRRDRSPTRRIASDELRRAAAGDRRRTNGESHVDIHDVPDRPQGAEPEQDADGADDARHDHRRRRPSSRWWRSATARRSSIEHADPVGRHQHHHGDTRATSARAASARARARRTR